MEIEHALELTFSAHGPSLICSFEIISFQIDSMICMGSTELDKYNSCCEHFFLYVEAALETFFWERSRIWH